jgi:DNA invertase Pin-like site-specific DNA recombinase
MTAAAARKHSKRVAVTILPVDQTNRPVNVTVSPVDQTSRQVAVRVSLAARKHSKKIAYIRVSSVDQNTDRQLESINGESPDKIFTDKCSGKDTKRPQLEAMLSFVREGDTVVVHSLDRLGRNLDDLRKLVADLNLRSITVQFLHEKLTFTGDGDSSMNKLMFNMLGSFAEFERSLIRERQREGIAIAKKAGVYRGRKPSLTAEQAGDLRKRVTAGEKKAGLAREFGISRETLYGYLRA